MAAAIAALHAPAVPGNNVKIINDDPVLIPYFGWPELEPSRHGGFGGVPRYNQRKSRKRARRCGIHPANSKRA